MIRILVVDDEPQILRALRINLSARAYDVILAETGRRALELAAKVQPDVVVLDLGLPDLDGVEVIRGLRGWTSVPIIVLSGRDNTTAKVRALDAGADDYVTKPFDVEELLARVRAVGRRGVSAEEQAQIRLGDVVVDLQNRRVTRVTATGPPPAVGEAAGGVALEDQPTGTDIHLTRTEWQILEILLRNPGKLVGQQELLRAIRGPQYREETHYLRQYLAQMRRKLEPDPARPRYLLTEPGMGYRFQP